MGQRSSSDHDTMFGACAGDAGFGPSPTFAAVWMTVGAVLATWFCAWRFDSCSRDDLMAAARFQHWATLDVHRLHVLQVMNAQRAWQPLGSASWQGWCLDGDGMWFNNDTTFKGPTTSGFFPRNAQPNPEHDCHGADRHGASADGGRHQLWWCPAPWECERC